MGRLQFFYELLILVTPAAIESCRKHGDDFKNILLSLVFPFYDEAPARKDRIGAVYLQCAKQE